MRLGVDIDGTLADNLGALVARFNEATGKILKESDVWDCNLARVYGLSSDEADRIYDADRGQVFADAPVFAGVAEALQMMKRGGAEIFVVTEREAKFEKLTAQWLNRHGIPYDYLLFESNKPRVCKDHGLSLFIDDCPNDIASVTSLQIPAILVDAPHNGHFHQHRGSPGGRWVRMYHWKTLKVITDALLRDSVSGM